MSQILRRYIYPFIIWVFYRCLSSTWRVQINEPDSLKQHLKRSEPVVFAHWHGDELVLVHLVRRYKTATIVSTSKDGEMMSTLLRLQGGKTSRGSSTRQAIQGLKGLIRLMKSGHVASIAVDGPKGPRLQVKPGVFELSRVASAPIYAAGCVCDRAWHFPKSWNKTYLPKPFAQIIVSWMGPVGPVTKGQDPKAMTLKSELEQALLESGKEAQALLEQHH